MGKFRVKRAERVGFILWGKLGPKGQKAKPSLGFVGQEAPYYSVPNGREEKTEGHMMEAMSETYRLYSCEYRAPVAWIGSHAVERDHSGLPPDGA